MNDSMNICSLQFSFCKISQSQIAVNYSKASLYIIEEFAQLYKDIPQAKETAMNQVKIQIENRNGSN